MDQKQKATRKVEAAAEATGKIGRVLPDGLGEALALVVEELKSALEKFPNRWAGPHEGIGILREEYLELEALAFWGLRHTHVGTERILAPKKRKQYMREEATQVAAMAIRFMIEVCEEDQFVEDVDERPGNPLNDADERPGGGGRKRWAKLS